MCFFLESGQSVWVDRIESKSINRRNENKII